MNDDSQIEMFSDVEKVDIPVHKRKTPHPTGRELRAVQNFASKGYTPNLSNYPIYHFTNKDTGEQVKLNITDLLSEYDAERREEARARASERRLQKSKGVQ